MCKYEEEFFCKQGEMVFICYNILDGALAERLRGGLQNLLDEFDSRTCLHNYCYKGVV